MKTKSKPAKKIGRPSNYLPEFCAEIVAFMAQGYTATAFAGSIGVSRDSIYQWVKIHPEFSDALKVARAQQIFYWERRLREAGKLRGDTTPIIFALKNACPDEWRDVQRLEHTGKDGERLDSSRASVSDLTGALAELGVELPTCMNIPINHRRG